MCKASDTLLPPHLNALAPHLLEQPLRLVHQPCPSEQRDEGAVGVLVEGQAVRAHAGDEVRHAR